MAIPTRQQFRRSLGNSPMAREANAIYDAALRGGLNPSFVAGLAAAESSYGTAGYARGTYNPFGLGVHLGWKFPNYAAATERLGQTLREGSYRRLFQQRGLAGIISRYTPASDGNNEGQHFRNIVSYGSRAGGDPRQVYVNPGAAPAAAAPSVTGSGIDTTQLLALMRQQTQNLRSGKGYDRKLGQQVRELVISQVGEGNVGGGRVPSSAVTGGEMPDGVNPDALGIGYGGVDSRKITRGGAGGDWAGSMPRALQFLDWAKQSGYRPNTPGRWLSQKRSRQNTASGGISDHWQGSAQSYGLDLGVPNVAEGDRLLSSLMRYFGQPSYKGGSWLNINKGGYRYQIGWRTPGHFDHIHVGVKKL
jgi:hypothetical protein